MTVEDKHPEDSDELLDLEDTKVSLEDDESPLEDGELENTDVDDLEDMEPDILGGDDVGDDSPIDATVVLDDADTSGLTRLGTGEEVAGEQVDSEVTESLAETEMDLRDDTDFDSGLTDEMDVTEAIDDDDLLEVTEAIDEDDLLVISADDDDDFGDEEEYETDEVTELVGNEDLDSLGSDLDDDEVLMGEESCEEFADGFEGEADEFFDQDAAAAGSRSGRFVRWFVSLAAVGVLACGGYYYMNPEIIDELLVKLGYGGSASVVDGGSPPNSGTDVDVNLVPDGGGETPPLLSDSEKDQQAFRKTVFLALRQGFLGEEAHE